MDYLQQVLDEDIIKKNNKESYIGISDLLIKIKATKKEISTCNNLRDMFIDYKNKINNVWTNCSIDNKKEVCKDLYNDMLKRVNNKNITEGVTYTILNRINNSYTKENMKEWKSVGIKILKLLYDYEYKLLYNTLKFNNINNDILVEDCNGNIKIYNKKYSKINKKLVKIKY